MTKYIVVTPNKIVHFDNYKEAYSYYKTLPKPCGVYELSGIKQGLITKKQLEIDVVYAVNIDASHFGGIEEQDSFLHLINMLHNNNYKESTR
ncbi:MAG: hypothetical protein ACRCXT_05620 [Paraclostridium sp.]